jgi:hypothetical protein
MINAKLISDLGKHPLTFCDQPKTLFNFVFLYFTQKIVFDFMLLSAHASDAYLRFSFSAISGGIVDRAIEAEDKKHGDFMRLVRYHFIWFT